jgi:hypothetical protein
MILLSASGQDRLSVFVSKEEPPVVTEVLRSLLNAREGRNGGFYIAVYDFPVLKERLDRLGMLRGREMDDHAAAMIRSYTHKLELNEQIKAGELNHEIEPRLEGGSLKSKLWTDQVADVRFCLRNPKVGVWHEPGCGKTIISLATFCTLKDAGLARYALVICPNSVKQNWLRQTVQHTSLSVAELGNGRGEILRNIANHTKKRTDICVTHYDALRAQEVQDRLVELPFDMCINDELHLCKNLHTQTSQAVQAVLQRIRPSVALVEADVLLEDGTITKAVVPASVKPGETVEFW